MTLLTNVEKQAVYKAWLQRTEKYDEIALIEMAADALLAKLAGMELPEPVVIDRHESGIVIRAHTADQLLQAFAQGAASQLADKPCAFLHTWADGEKLPLLHDQDCRINDQPIAVEPLFTRKEAP